jgi:iron complex outermembrane receptor protein
MTVKSALLDEKLRFTDKEFEDIPEYSIDSRIHTRQYIGMANYWRSFGFGWFLEGGTSIRHTQAWVANYGGPIYENDGELYGIVKYSEKRISFKTSVKNIFPYGYDPTLIYSVGFRYRLLEGLEWDMHFGNRYRKPSLNDRYWMPGGNPDLKPEKGNGVDVSISYNKQPAGSLITYKGSVSVYRLIINDWIQWLPLGTQFVATNHKKVRNSGMELNLSPVIALNSIRLEPSIQYHYLRAINLDSYHGDHIVGKQLRYIPLHSTRASITATLNEYWFRVSVNQTGARYSTEENHNAFGLPGYAILNLAAGNTLNISGNDITFSVRVHNILDRSYQVIRSYAMPGRSFHLNILMTLHQKADNGKF